MRVTVLMHTAAAILLATGLVSTPRIASANCEHADRQHGGTAFLAPLAGGWRVSGEITRERLDGHANGVMDGGVLKLVFRIAHNGTRAGIAALSLRYDAHCDDFVGVRDEWGTDGRLRRSNGRGVARGSGLDITFPAQSDGHRTDVTLEWDAAHAKWLLQTDRELADGRWVQYGGLRLERSREGAAPGLGTSAGAAKPGACVGVGVEM